ncbi:hypothetical protein B0H14DRAFT_3700429 [Mycena olivaceomarginata]|nr:hypothetical protein B0H14DRAFT_3700429 [Mycena olivaceomarginata]
MGPLRNGALPRKGKRIDHTQARQTSGAGHKTAANRVQRIYGFMLGKAQEFQAWQFWVQGVFVACNSATTRLELVNLFGAHLGLKPGKDLTKVVLQYFFSNPPSLLILDELETLWEPASSRGDIEELLSLLTGVENLALMAARLTFADIADSGQNVEEVDQILSLTDNMPHVISLLAYLADTEGCSNVLTRWEKEKTSLISEGFDKRSNLDLSISLSLLSPRIQLLPQSQELLSLLSMLPDGLADVDLIQSELPLENILQCKTAPKSTALAYTDEHRRLKVLMPIREYLQNHHPSGDHLVQSVLKYFAEMLHFYQEYYGTQNFQNNFLNKVESHKYSECPAMGTKAEPTKPVEEHLAYFATELLSGWRYYPISNPEALASRALEHLQHFDDQDLEYYIFIWPLIIRESTLILGGLQICAKRVYPWQLPLVTAGDRVKHCVTMHGLPSSLGNIL